MAPSGRTRYATFSGATHAAPSGDGHPLCGRHALDFRRPAANSPDLVETFDDAPSGQIATVEEQRAFAEAWREDPKQR